MSSSHPDVVRGPRRWLGLLASLVVLLVAWSVVAAADLVEPHYLTPSPLEVWDAFVRANSYHPVGGGVDRVVRGEEHYFLWEHLVVSLRRIGLGLVLGVVVGVPLGLLMGTVRWVGDLVGPYVDFLRSLPPLAYIGFLVAWFGIYDTSKVWLLFLAAFPPITLATINGVRGVKQDQLNAARSLGASGLQLTTQVVLPATLPDILSGLRVAVGFAWTTVVAAELVNGLPGIGGLAYLSGTQNKIALSVACILVIGLTAIALDAVIRSIEKLVVPWRGKA
ncbi:taurine transport system permease protein [Nocardioides aromaticivorans]|uniref:Taurine ABC transporter permease n=1 Tax=Nocardioides aromaticivorans TaxID=200618 RepID=A0A7Z0CMI0_9ACTN|nr:ABC transporter permease [Nocardioides aromaticivorans]NYI43875.1 taurine transport system permease protein [Nocardioides aromaticivorans]QSR27837.1 taurine ABC transporter permease [Nocardioides aromaticivorans]